MSKLKDLDYKKPHTRISRPEWNGKKFISWKVPSGGGDPIGFYVYHTDGKTLTQKGYLDDYLDLLEMDGWIEIK